MLCLAIFHSSNSSEAKKGGAKIPACKFCDNFQWLPYCQSNGPHFGASCSRPNRGWNTDMYRNRPSRRAAGRATTPQSAGPIRATAPAARAKPAPPLGALSRPRPRPRSAPARPAAVAPKRCCTGAARARAGPRPRGRAPAAGRLRGCGATGGPPAWSIAIHVCVPASVWPTTGRPKMWAVALAVRQPLKVVTKFAGWNLRTTFFSF